MNVNFNYKKGFFSALIILFLSSFIFLSCSQSLPEISYINSSVIFSYENEKSLPDVRLSLFVQNTSDVRRCERISVTSQEADYTWETENLRKISAGGYAWAGNVNLNVPKGEKIPQGEYVIKYVNADEEEDQTLINLLYDEDFYNITSSQVPDLMKKNKGVEKLAIYDKNTTLLYYGDKTEELSSKGDIFNTYPEAVFFQNIWISSNKTVICVLPEIKL